MNDENIRNAANELSEFLERDSLRYDRSFTEQEEAAPL